MNHIKIKKIGGRIGMLCVFMSSLLLLMLSCTAEESDSLRPILTDEKEVILSLHIPGQSKTVTRLTEAQESTVGAVNVLVFDATSKEYLYSSIAFSGNGQNGDEGTFNFIVRLHTTEVNQSIDLWVIANAPSIVGSKTSDFEEKTKAEIAAMLLAEDRHLTSSIPMWGELTGRTVTEAGLVGGNSVTLMRMAAKINVEVAANGTLRTDFKLTEAWLYNRNTKGRIVPGEIGGDEWSAPTLQAGYVTTTYFPTAGEEKSDTPQQYSANNISLTNPIYTFEASAGEGYESDNGDYTTEPCLIIGGKYGSSTATTTYYRVDFAKTEDSEHQPLANPEYFPLLRNHSYMVSIQAISGPGFTNKDDALHARPLNASVAITDWSEGEDVNVEFDGSNYLSVSSGILVLPGRETLTIETDCAEGWMIDDIPAWVTASGGTSGDNGAITGSAEEGPVTLTFEAIATPDVLHFHITAGRLKRQITIHQITFESSEIENYQEIARANPNFSMFFKGTYSGILTIHAESDGISVGETTVTATGNNIEERYSVTVNSNESWHTRDIVYSYSIPGIEPIPITGLTHTQHAYYITATGADKVSAVGGDYALIMSGEYPPGTTLMAYYDNMGDVMENPTPVPISFPKTLLTLRNNLDTNATIVIIATSNSVPGLYTIPNLVIHPENKFGNGLQYGVVTVSVDLNSTTNYSVPDQVTYNDITYDVATQEEAESNSLITFVDRGGHLLDGGTTIRNNTLNAILCRGSSITAYVMPVVPPDGGGDIMAAMRTETEAEVAIRVEMAFCTNTDVTFFESTQNTTNVTPTDGVPVPVVIKIPVPVQGEGGGE